MGINFYNVTFKYDKKSKTNILNNINLSINDHDEFITIVGQTGSGKSTLVQLMNALLLPGSGYLEINNQIIKPKNKKKLKAIRKSVGLVFQFPEYQLFEETVLKDLMFGPKNFGQSKVEAKQSALDAAKSLNIPDELLERPPFNLSGGQKRKVAIGGIIASKPNILILDEPTVGLDPRGKTELINLLKYLHKEQHKTIIVVTHNMDFVAQLATRVIVLNQGNITFDGAPCVLFNDFNLLQANHLDLPYISKIAIELKKANMLDYDKIPLTVNDIYQLLEGGDIYE